MNTLFFVTRIVCIIITGFSLIIGIFMIYLRYKKPLKRYINNRNKIYKEKSFVVNLNESGEIRREIIENMFERKRDEVCTNVEYSIRRILEENEYLEQKYDENKVIELDKWNCETNYKKAIG